MPRGLHLALPPLLVTAGCAANSADEDFAQRIAELQGLQQQQECGFGGAMGLGGRGRAQLGDAVRACELPTIAEVELACEVHEAVPNPNRRDPGNPDDVLYDLPDFTISALSCTFEDTDSSRATCTFQLATTTAPARPVKAVLIHRFSARNTPLTFEYYTRWGTPGSCLARAGTDQAS